MEGYKVHMRAPPAATYCICRVVLHGCIELYRGQPGKPRDPQGAFCWTNASKVKSASGPLAQGKALLCSITYLTITMAKK